MFSAHKKTLFAWVVGGGGCGCPPLLARRLLCVGRQVVRGSCEPCGAARGRQWSRCCLGGRAELFEVCYWFFRLNVCAAVAFLLFNTSRESFEKKKYPDTDVNLVSGYSTV